MNKIFLGVDLFKKELCWDYTRHNSAFIGGLSGSGKSFLISRIIEQFLELDYRIIIISEKARVDFKDPRIERINTLEEIDRIQEVIEDISEIMTSIKRRVENSPHSANEEPLPSEKILLVVDELWATDLLPKELNFNVFCDNLIRTARYMKSIQVIFASQISRVAESKISLRQSSIIISGKTDTRELSQSLFGTDIAYSSDFLKRGVLLFWDRESNPKILKVVKRPFRFSIYLRRWILKLLTKISTISQ